MRGKEECLTRGGRKRMTGAKKMGHGKEYKYGETESQKEGKGKRERKGESQRGESEREEGYRGKCGGKEGESLKRRGEGGLSATGESPDGGDDVIGGCVLTAAAGRHMSPPCRITANKGGLDKTGAGVARPPHPALAAPQPPPQPHPPPAQ